MNDITWYADLGIEVKSDHDAQQYSFCWRMVPPAPATDWSDPYLSATAAYRAAVLNCATWHGKGGPRWIGS
jgi:hypothetical protein